MRRFTLKWIGLAAAMMILLIASASGSVKKEIKKEFSVKPGGELNLETDRGSVEVLTTTENKVIISVKLDSRTSKESRAEEMFEDFEIEFTQDGNNVTIDAEYFGDDSRTFNFFGSDRRNLQVKYEILVPKKYNVFVNTSGGSIGVGDIEGAIRVRTSGGSLHFEDINGPVKGKTSGGSIVLESCRGTADVRTSGGSIQIGHVEGDVEAHTSGGSISVDEVMGSIDASTSGGSISAYITKQPTNDCSLKTSGGSVRVNLASDVSVDIDARTSSGRVRCDFVDDYDSRYSKRKSSLQTSIGKGGPELYLRTSGGDIRINEI